MVFFDLHDADGSGSLSLAELVAVVDDIGRAPAEDSPDAFRFEMLMQQTDTSGDGELNFDEFVSFLAEYYQSVYERLYKESDEDNSGQVSKFEIKGLMVLLRDSGFKVRGEDIAEMFLHIDSGTGGDGELNWEEFCNFMTAYRKLEFDLLKDSAGFNERELEYLTRIYAEADVDDSGTLAIREVVELLEKTMIGSYVDTQEEINKIVTLFARIDKDKSMTLDQLEFLRLLRVWSNAKETKATKKHILEHFKQSSSVIIPDEHSGGGGGEAEPKKSLEDTRPRFVAEHKKELRQSTKENLGLKCRIKASLSSSGLDQEEAEKAFIARMEKIQNELRTVAIETDIEDGVLAQTCNLQIEEVRCLRESFEFCDADGSGFIDSEELVMTLRNLGCAATTPCQKKALSKVRDLKEYKGNLNFASLVRFLLMYQQSCADEILLDMKQDGNGVEGVLIDKLVQALYKAGQYLNKAAALKLLEKVGGDPESKVVDPTTFSKMLEVDRSDKTFEWRKKCGFTDNQVAAIRHAFDENCRGGIIMNRDGRVLEALRLLNLEPSPEKRDQLMVSLLRVDREGQGTLAFEDFLLLVRRLENQKLYLKTQKEKNTIQTSGLDAAQVQQFRQVFADCEPNETGLVGIPRIQSLFSELGLITKQVQRKQLQEVINTVIGNNKHIEASRQGLAFFQFLEVLQQLDKIGFGR